LANVSKVLDSIVTGLNQSVASLQKVTPPSDFKAFNASVITAFAMSTPNGHFATRIAAYA
jgi:hypothetical protein